MSVWIHEPKDRIEVKAGAYGDDPTNLPSYKPLWASAHRQLVNLLTFGAEYLAIFNTVILNLFVMIEEAFPGDNKCYHWNDNNPMHWYWFIATSFWLVISLVAYIVTVCCCCKLPEPPAGLATRENDMTSVVILSPIIGTDATSI